MFKEKGKTGLKGGFDLLGTYPVRFCNIIEKITSDGVPETFEFHVPGQKVLHVIVNLCPTEPWSLPNWTILEHKTTAFLDKLKEIKSRYLQDAKYYIAIDKKEEDRIGAIKGYAYNEEWLEVLALDAKYPQDDPVVFAKVVLGTDICFGQDLSVQGILILDAQTVSAIYESSVAGNKVDSRFITLSGTGLRENEIINVQLGTSVEKILEKRTKETSRFRVFVNGPLRGREITDFSLKIDWTVNTVVVLEEKDYKVVFPMIKAEELNLTTNVLGEARRCVYCNFCDDVCPVGLEPALYYHSYKKGEKHNARLYNMERCIECGLCSFVCPSKIELLQIIKECKALDKKI